MKFALPFRHPEVAGKRPSKDDPVCLGPTPPVVERSVALILRASLPSHRTMTRLAPLTIPPRQTQPLASWACATAWLVTFTPVTAQERLAIVTTTADLHSLAEAVGGDRVAVTSLVPAGFDPEEYQPRPRDIALLKQARAVARVGLDFDLWFDRLLAQADERVRRGGAGYVDASYAIATLDVRGASIGPGDGPAHGDGNPHY